jgi:hypothetical protein
MSRKTHNEQATLSKALKAELSSLLESGNWLAAPNGPPRLTEGRYREWQRAEPAAKIGDILPLSQGLRVEHQGAI